MAALQYLSNSRIPLGYYLSGGRVSHVRLEHVYVEAYIPYTNYRGTGEDDKGKGWVPLDPSFKRYDLTQQGIDLTTAIGFDWKSFSTEYLNDLQNITPLEYYRNKIDDFIGQNYPGQSLDTLKRKSEIRTMKFDFLPNTLPYKVSGIIDRFSAIPSGLGHTLRFMIPGETRGRCVFR